MSDQEKKPSPPQEAPQAGAGGTPPAEPPTTPAQAAPVEPPASVPVTPAPVPSPAVPATPAPAPATTAADNPTPIVTPDAGKQTLLVNTGGKSAGITCPKCGHVNRAGVLVCESCGTLLINEEQPLQSTGTKRFEGDQQESDADPKRNTSIETSEIVSVAVSTAGTGTFSDSMVLRLEIEGAPTPILLTPKAETSIGRRDPATGTMPDVDLSAYSGYRLGVSRKHAVIRLNEKTLQIYDLGSSNGTSVNGVRLSAHQPHPLRDGDEIMLGKMIVRVLFQARNRRKS